MTIEVIQGDCLEAMPRLIERGIRADLVFTSPPYNLGDERGNYPTSGRWRGGADKIGGGYLEHADAMPHSQYVAWQQDVLRECWRLLSERGAIFYNHKPRVVRGSLRLPIDLVPSELRPYVRQEIIWARCGGLNFSASFFCPTSERIIVIAKPEWRLKDRAASGLGDVWRIPAELNTQHPAPFPVELPLRALQSTTARVVVDPFAGSCTTGVAAIAEGRDFIGIEQSAEYCALGEARMKRAGGIACDIPKLIQRERPAPLFDCAGYARQRDNDVTAESAVSSS